MSIFGLSLWMGLAAAGTALVLWVSIRRSLRLRATRRAAVQAPAGEGTESPAPEILVSTADGGTRAPSRLARVGLGQRRAEAPPPRLEALVAAQADLAARVEALGAVQSAPEERLQGMAAQLLGLVRDKNATLETALAGLDQLRERMRAIEQMGEPAEARALLERLEGRLDEIRSSQAAGAAALDARIAGLEAPSGNAVAELADRLTRLHAQKDAVAETVLARIATLEQGLAARDPAPALDRLAIRIDETRAALEARVAALEAANPLAEISEQFARLHARKDAAVEAVLTRLQPLEARLGELSLRVEARDPAAGIARLEAELEERVAALRAAHAAAETALAARVSLLETPEKNPFTEISAQLTRLYAQKDATVETVFARLQPLEARLGELDRRLTGQDPRALLDRFAERLEAVQGRVAQIEAEDSPFADISDQLTRLYAQKDAAVEAVLARLQPLETRLADFDRRLAGADPAALLDRFAERLEAVRGALDGRIAQLEAPGENPFADISDQLARLYAQKDATVETVFARLQPLEARLTDLDRRLAGADPSVALARFAERLEAVRNALEGRLTALETEENPFTEISDQLARLYAQKDATVETVFARLQPLEARLVELDQRLAGADPALLLDRFAERLEAVRGALDGRIAQLEAPEDNPFAEISEQLTRLYAQKDATVETVFARLQPLEAQLADLDRRLAGQDPAGVLDRFAERLETVQGRVAQLEAVENPFAEISEQLTRLYAQKDATVETVFARLQPLEARLVELDQRLAGADPALLLDRFAERLEAVRGALDGRIAQLEAPEDNPFAEISEQLTRLYAQKDATVETVFARLQPLEAQLADLDRRLAGQDPAGVLDRFAERLETVQGRVAQLEAVENPFAEISEQLTRLYAQKDATVETVFARLQPLEAKLADLEAGLGALRPLAESLAAEDPRAELDGLTARIEALNWAQGEVAAGLAALKAAAEAEAAAEAAGLTPVAGLADQLTRLYAQKDAGLAQVLERLAPLEARLSGLEARPWDPAGDEARDEARAQAQAIAAQMIAARTASDQVAAQTGLFADRLALLEASLPRLSAAQATLMQALEARTLAMAAPAIAAAIAPGMTLGLQGFPAAPLPGQPGGAIAPPAPAAGAQPADRESGAATGPSPAAGPVPGPGTPGQDDIWTMPRLISLHQR